MDKNQAQARDIIRNTFEQPFDKARFTSFVRNLLNHFEDAPFLYQGQYIPDSFKPFVGSYERIGRFTDGDNRIDILIVKLFRTTSLEQARTSQRNFIAGYLQGKYGSTNEKDAALVAFVSPDAANWRFSLVRLDYSFDEKYKPKQDFTPARRWSFLVGAGEKSHTAQSRLVKILAESDHDPTLADLEEAFNIETVTTEFFREYRNLFIRTKEALDEVVQNTPKVKADFDAKGVNTVDFAKKLLGQIVFLYFLQKKGWFGVGRDADWRTGSKHFLRELFEGKHGGYDNFFNDILEPLFYEALRRPRDDDYYKHFNCKIPFLNGGLFDPIGNNGGYDWVHTDINLPDALFSNKKKTKKGDEGDGILDIFDRYNFTVKEDEPLEKEVAIDPELLGKAYEKFNAIRPDNFEEYKNALKSGRKGDETRFNKQFGVYYTPREIVHYMCRESLISYLATELNRGAIGYERLSDGDLDLFGNEGKKGQMDLNTPIGKGLKISKEDIEALIHTGEHLGENEEIALVKARRSSEGKQNGSKYTARLPESIRTHAGLIDKKLEEIAVCDPAVGSGAFPVGMMSEIVKTRMLLNPYLADKGERTPYRFKRRCIEHSLYGVDIDPGAVEIAKLRLWLSLVVDEEDIKTIRPLPNLDYKIVRGNSLVGFPLYAMKDIHLQSRIEQLKIEFFKETNPTDKLEIKERIDQAFKALVQGAKKYSSNVLDTDFDFRIHFSEVFHKKDGFDVVIGNPPYVRQEQIKAYKRWFKAAYRECYASAADIYVYFYEKGLDILHERGILAFITSNKYMRAGYGKGLRQLLAAQRIETLIDFCELPVFDAAADPMIVIIIKGSPPLDHEFPVAVIKKESEFDYLQQSLVTRGTRYKTEHLKSEGWSLERGDGFPLIEKLRSKGSPLGDCLNGRFYYGIKTGLNEAFIIDDATRDRFVRDDPESEKLIKPWIRGRDIKRWMLNGSGLCLIQIESSENVKHPWSGMADRRALDTFKQVYPSIAKHLLSYEKTLRTRTDQGRYFWELRSCDYWEEFEEPKIVIADIGKVLKAAWSESGHVIGNTGYIIPKTEPFLLAVLLSTVIDWYARMTFQGLGDPWAGGRMRFINRNLATIPIPLANPTEKSRLTRLTEQAASLAEAGNMEKLQMVDKEIDAVVYQLFDLTPDEILHIKKSLVNTGREYSDSEYAEDNEQY